jgi:hypothetical protein
MPGVNQAAEVFQPRGRDVVNHTPLPRQSKSPRRYRPRSELTTARAIEYVALAWSMLTIMICPQSLHMTDTFRMTAPGVSRTPRTLRPQRGQMIASLFNSRV